MFKIAVCDDEEIFRKNIYKIIMKYMDENGCPCEIDEFETGNEFINLGINMTKYDIVFLDINMDEIDGIETAQEIRKVSNDIFIVFVTAFISYAVEGYSVNAIRYILKNNEKFAELIFECIDAISKKMNHSVKKKEFKFSEGVKNISLELLLYIESKLHKLNFHIMEDKLNTYSLYGKLDEFEKELEDKAFLRIHQSYLINMKHIVSIYRYEAVLNNGIKLKISKDRYKFVKEKFVSYKGEI